jgi:hypothetical protein
MPRRQPGQPLPQSDPNPPHLFLVLPVNKHHRKLALARRLPDNHVFAPKQLA